MNSRNPKELREIVTSARRSQEFPVGGFSKMLGGRQNADQTSDSDDDSATKMRASKARAFSESDKQLINELKAKLTEQKMELDSKNAAIAAVQRNFESLSNMCKTDREEIARLNGLLSDAKAQAEHLKGLESDIRAWESKYDKDIRAKENIIASLRNELEAAKLSDSSKRLEYESLLAKSHSSQKSLQADHEILKQSFSSAKGEIEEYRRKVRTLENQLSTAQCSSSEQYQNFQAQLQEAQLSRNAIEKQVGMYQKEIASLNSKISALENKCQSLSNDLTESRNLQSHTASELRNEREKSSATITALSKKIHDLEHHNRAGGQSLDSIREKCASLEAELEKERETYARHNESISLALKDANERLRHLQDEETSNRLAIEQGNEKIRGLEQKLSHAQKSADDRSRDLEKKTTEWSQLRKTYEDLNVRLGAAENKVSHLTETIQEKDQQIQALTRDLQSERFSDGKTRAQEILTMEKELKTVVAKLMHANEAMQANVSCMYCLDNFKHPETCVPCGHSFCSACVVQLKDETAEHGDDRYCHLCGTDAIVDSTYRNEMLEQICAKYEFQQQALAVLAEMSKRLSQQLSQSR